MTQILFLGSVGVLGLTVARSETEAKYVEKYNKARVPNSGESKQQTKPEAQPNKEGEGQTTKGGQRSPLAQHQLESGSREQLLGLTPYGTAIFLSETDYSSNIGHISQWGIAQKKEGKRILLTEQLDSQKLRLSPNGRFLISTNQRTLSQVPKMRAHRITVLQSSDFAKVGEYDLGMEKDIVGINFLPEDQNHVVLKVLSVIPFVGADGKSNATFGKDRFEWMHIATGKIDKELPYRHARGCDELRFSPGNQFLSCLFTDEHFDLVDDKFDRQGIVDTLDPKSGRIIWHIEGKKNMSVGRPLFFVSPTEFVSSDKVFNVTTKTSRPWKAVTASRQYITEIPSRSGYAMFLTPSGTELRNWKTNRTLQRWPTLKRQGRFFFSPDLKFFAWKHNREVQFWKFSPNWLK